MVGGILRSILIYLSLFTIALIPRLLGISFHSMWYDETSTAHMISQDSFSTMFKALNAVEGTPPLFYIMEKIFVDSIGILNEFTIRFLPMLFGTLSCVLMFHLVRKISSLKNALFTFILIVLSNCFIYLSNEARCYSTFGFLVLINLVFVVEWWIRPTRLKEFLILVSLFFLTQIHFYSLFWVSALTLSGYIFLPNKKNHKTFLIIYGATVIISYLLMVPFFLNQSPHEVGGIRENLTSNWLPGIIFAPVKVVLHAYLYKIYSIKEISSIAYLGIVSVLLIILISVVVLVKRVQKGEPTVLEKFVFSAVFFAFCFHCIIGFAVPTIHPRYMAHFLIFLFPLAVINSGVNKNFQIGIISVLLFFNIWASINFYNKKLPFIEPYREITKDILPLIDGSNLPILAEHDICRSISFNTMNRHLKFYQIPWDISIDKPFIRYTVNTFGNELFTAFYNDSFYPMIDTTTVRDIFLSKKRGLFLLREKKARETESLLEELFDKRIEFTLIKTYPTNQGDITLLKWKLKDQSS